MKDRLLAFLNDIDATLSRGAVGGQLVLYHIGRSALVWRYGFDSVTYDVDVIVPGGDEKLESESLRLFGRGTPKSREHGLFLDPVPSAFPPTPSAFKKRATEIMNDWSVLRLFHLDPNDLAITKLRRFAAKDREDIRQMCDNDLLDPAKLAEYFDSAFWPYVNERFREEPFEHLQIVLQYLRNERDEF